jgi:ABC-2 type transport system ATP-binding protein
MKRRLEISRGLLHRPKVLFLDEPTLGLDPQTRRHIWEYLFRLRDRRGITMFLTTHYMDEAENCDRIAIIDHGQIVALDTPEGLKGLSEAMSLQCRRGQPAAGEAGSTQGIQTDLVRRQVIVETDRHLHPHMISTFSGGTRRGQGIRRPTLEMPHQTRGRAIREEEASGKTGGMTVFQR